MLQRAVRSVVVERGVPARLCNHAPLATSSKKGRESKPKKAAKAEKAPRWRSREVAGPWDKLGNVLGLEQKDIMTLSNTPATPKSIESLLQVDPVPIRTDESIVRDSEDDLEADVHNRACIDLECPPGFGI